ncbi:hypothetical protein L7F22_014079 [Adiantum nelumboides]|nr:hypothetical protein [Adiantum nelumboides]
MYEEFESADSAFGASSGARSKYLEVLGTHQSYEGGEDTKQMTEELCSMDDMFRCMEDHQLEENAKQKEIVQLVQEEEKEIGNVSFAVYSSLIRVAYRGSLVPSILLSQTMFQCLQIASNYWLAWATPKTDNEEPGINMKKVLVVYVILACGSTACVLVRTISMAAVTLKTAQIYFTRMLQCILHAPMSFFDSTPTGRFLNRVSPFLLCDVSSCLVVGVSLHPSLWGLHMDSAVLCGIGTRAGKTGGSEQSAPVVQHFGETISGAATIRAFKKQDDFVSKNLQLIDQYSMPYFHNIAAMEWLCFRLDLLTNCIFTVSLLIIVSVLKDSVDPSVAGLAVTYGLNLNVIQSRLTWNLCNL